MVGIIRDEGVASTFRFQYPFFALCVPSRFKNDFAHNYFAWIARCSLEGYRKAPPFFLPQLWRTAGVRV